MHEAAFAKMNEELLYLLETCGNDVKELIINLESAINEIRKKNQRSSRTFRE